MSATIDNKVVSMEFDNSRFERNVKTSLDTIDQLKQSLNLTGATRGLENVDAAAKRINMNGLVTAAETVGLKFNWMYTVADQALRNITNSAMAAGKRVINALTIDPVKTGLSEYETQINAVQTILANTESKGTTLPDVTKALDELNAYADKTIYNFTEMTRNIGTFTAAGVDLDTSVTAIQGIANLAAVSGSTSQQASVAMYQLSQALSSGTVKLMDWNSVVNAGMGGQVFQDALKETARVHGVAIDDLIKKNGSFRETLQEGWLTSEILLETLDKFTMTTEGLTKAEIEANREKLRSKGYTDEQIEAIFKLGNTATNAATKVKTFTQLWDTLKETAQSGWTQTWELILGDFEEAKELFSGLYNTIAPMIDAMSKARNDLLQGWKDSGGRAMLVESLYNVINGVLSIVKPIKEAFREIFPPITVKQLLNFTKGLRDLTANLKISDSVADKLKRTFKGIFAVFGIAKNIILGVVRVISPLFGEIGNLSGGLLDLTASIGDWLVDLHKSIESSELLKSTLEGIGGVIKFAVEAIKTLAGSFNKLVLAPSIKLLHAIFGRFHESLAGIGEAAGEMRDGIANAFDSAGSAISGSTLFKILGAVWKAVLTLGSELAHAIGGVFSKIADSLERLDFDGVLEMLNSLISTGIGVAIIKWIYNLADSFSSVAEFGGSICEVIENVGDALGAWKQKIQAQALLEIAKAIAILSVSLLLLSLADSDNLSAAMSGLTMLFIELAIAMAVLTKITSGKAALGGVLQTSMMMKSLATAILILSISMAIMGSLGIEGIIAGLLGVGALMAAMVIATKALRTNEKAMINGIAQMILFAYAIRILASACKVLAELSPAELLNGLIGVAGLMEAVLIFLQHVKVSEKSIANATGVVIIAAAIKILASACQDLSYLNWDELAKGLIGVGGIMAALVGFTKLTSGAQNVVAIGIGMIAMAAAMKILASACKDFAYLNWEDLVKGLAGVGGILAALMGFVKLASGAQSMITTGLGLIAVATGLYIIANAVVSMGNVSWASVAKSLITLGGALAILAASLHAMKGTLTGSAALIVAAVAINMLVIPLSILGAMSWQGIAKGFVALAGAFIVMSIAGTSLAPLIPTLLALSVVFVLIGASILAMGVGLVAAGAGLSAVAVGVTALAIALGSGLTAIAAGIRGFIGEIIGIIPTVFTALGNGIVALFVAIGDGFGAIVGALKKIVLAIVDVLVECIPAIVDGALKLIFEILKALTQYAPQIVKFIFQFLVEVLDALAAYIPQLVKSAMGVLMGFFYGVVEALKDIDYDVMIKAIGGVGLMTALVAALGAIVPMIPGAMLGVVGLGVIVGELAIVLASIGALSKIPGLEELIMDGGYFMQTVGTAIGQFIGGILGGSVKGFTNSLPEIAYDLSEFMENLKPFIEGMNMIDESMLTSASVLAGVILAITAADVIEGAMSWFSGGSSIADFSYELPTLGENLKEFSDAVAGIVPENMMAAVDAAKAIAQMSNIIPNEGGVASWFAGENSMAAFAENLPALGSNLKAFSDEVAGVNPEAVKGAASAAKALADMASVVPNEGGVVSWFAGDNSLSKFAEDIVELGKGLSGFSKSVTDISVDNVKAGVEAAKSIANMASVIPNEGGVASWFAGDNSLSDFSEDLVELGKGLKGFSDELAGINTDSVTAGTTAAKSLAEMMSIIPNQGGVASWFAGDASIAAFGDELPKLGAGLKGFSDSVIGIDAENIIGAANAAKALADLMNIVPNEGGMRSWFTGDSSMSKLGENIRSLGSGLKGFALSVEGISAESVTAAANAAKGLAELTTIVPNEGGMKAWFVGDSSFANFAGKLPALGSGLKKFSDSVAGISVESVTAASNAAKTLAEMTAIIPTEGGIKAWFTGETSIANFASKLPALGKGLKGFSDNVAGISAENTGAAANAAKSLGEMTSTIPKNTDKLADFGENLVDFGGKLKSYFTKMSGITKESISASTDAIKAVNDIATSDSGKIKSLATAIDDIVDAVKGMAKVTKSSARNFKDALEELGKTSTKSLLKPFEDLENDMKKAGKKAIDAFAKGVEDKVSTATKAIKSLADDCADAIEEKDTAFKSAGRQLVVGFAKGISENSYKAEAKARAMAKAAAKAAEEALDINSPSKVGYGIGDFFGLGFVYALEDYADISYAAGAEIGNSAQNGLRNAIRKITDTVNSDIDNQPTIRPVLDLSDVQRGADAISGMLSEGTSISAFASAGSINSTMSRRSQNGGMDELRSAIDDLRKDMKHMGNTYVIDGVTYDDGSELYDAVQTIVRAAKVERRK